MVKALSVIGTVELVTVLNELKAGQKRLVAIMPHVCVGGGAVCHYTHDIIYDDDPEGKTEGERHGKQIN